MLIRFAKLDDEKQVLNLLDELIEEVNRLSGRPPKLTQGNDARSKQFQEILNKDNVKVFVVEEGNQLLGVTDVFINPIMRRGHYQAVIEDFVVTQKLRGKGIGTQLLDAIKDFCRENNIKVIKLTSGLELVNAHKFYEKHGFEFTEKSYRFDLEG